MTAGNGQKCECGGHEGYGYFPDGTPLTAGDRAARYQRLKERLPHYFTPDMTTFLQSYEAMHGKVDYEMKERGKATGEYCPKGVPVMCPVARGQYAAQSQRQGYNWGG